MFEKDHSIFFFLMVFFHCRCDKWFIFYQQSSIFLRMDHVSVMFVFTLFPCNSQKTFTTRARLSSFHTQGTFKFPCPPLIIWLTNIIVFSLFFNTAYLFKKRYNSKTEYLMKTEKQFQELKENIKWNYWTNWFEICSNF